MKDLGSTNHTFLNGRELLLDEKKRLKDGDEIAFGKKVYRFRL